MAHDRRKQAALMIALGLAMKSKLGEPDPEVLGHTVIAVGETFAVDDPMQIAVKHFADTFPLARRNPSILQKAGEQLFMAVIRACWPMPTGRADIEG